MKKVICCFMALLLLVSAALPLNAVDAQAASLRSKKVVSVVYDDSGSMSGANWAYANYAMQTFVAMLNEEDELYITYMSDEENAVRIRTQDLLDAVKDIREHADMVAYTPYKSVETAMKQLEKVQDKNPSTQYWLVVFSDGGFTDGVNIDTVSDELDKFNSKKMANGTTPQIMYMTIGDDEYDSYTPHPSDPDITVMSAKNETDVRDELFDIASRVTGRIRAEDADMSFTDEHTVTVTSNVPLLNISILVQNKEISVESIKDSDRMDIPIKYEIPVKMPDNTISGAEGINDMFGAVTLAGEKDKNIPAGTYTITFSDKIDKDDIVIMLEPALQLRIKLFIDGVEVTDTDEINLLTRNLSAKAAVYEFGTDNVIMESLLPGSVSRQMTFSVDDKVIDSTDKFELDPIRIAEGENEVRAVLDISGYFHLDAAVDFSPERVPAIDRIDAELSYDGSPRAKDKNGDPDPENVVYVSDLKNNKTGILFTVYQDGAPIDHGMAKSLEGAFRDAVQADFNNFTVDIQGDGKILVYPSKKPWFVPMDLYFLQHHGDQTVKVDLNGVSAEGVLRFRFFRDLWDFVLHVITDLLILYAIWWILFKKHFPKGRLRFYSGRQEGMDLYYIQVPGGIDLNWIGSFRETNLFTILGNLILFILPMPARTKLGGYTFIGQNSLVGRNTKLKVKNVRGAAVSSTNPQPSSARNDPTAEMLNTLYIQRNETYKKFTFRR